MNLSETVSSAPISVEKSLRGDEVRALTSCRAGKIVPVAYIPMLREDQVTSGSLRISLDMAETIHPLMNSVNVTAYAHFVPFLCFDRFNGSMEVLNRSYQGMPEPHNDQVVPFFQTVPFTRNSEIFRTMGIHSPEGSNINSVLVEAYNELVNFRRKARSAKLPLRATNDQTLAAAFWRNPGMTHIVPDFDDAAMDGEVELQWTTPQLRISGIGRRVGSNPTPGANTSVTEYGGVAKTYPFSLPMSDASIALRTGVGGGADIFAELESAGVRVSLANIELAKKTAAFAKLRDKFSHLDDDHIIDLLMEGIRVPDEALRQPILLDRKATIFGYSERHAMDGDNLEKSVTTGSTSIDLKFRTPPMNVGGVIMITIEVVPEQLFERCQDVFLSTTDPARLPNFLRDYLDPQKVDVVQNRYVDVFHSTPTATFGYAPLNHHWKRSLTRIGGRYYRPNPDTFVEDRQRFWAVEQLNPTLTTDFYLVGNLPSTVFVDSFSDPFEVLTLGKASIVGNTVFGKVLEEDENNYEAVMSQVDRTRIQP